MAFYGKKQILNRGKEMITTTKEQGERLVVAGVSPKSADCSFVHTENHARFQNGGEIHEAQDHIACYPGLGFPAWSLSALWEIARKRNILFAFSDEDTIEEVFETLVSLIEKGYKND